LVNGYLFVNAGSDNKFLCAGKIQGPAGAAGKEGKGIVNIVNYYLNSSLNSGVIAG
jgi:hypothetical protein